MKARYRPEDPGWRVERGSVLDPAFMAELGRFDVVYSWGVLHHTGAMWEALNQAQRAVGEKGSLFIAIYNDTGSQSARWKQIKHIYTRLPQALKAPFALAVSAPEEAQGLSAVARRRPSGRLRSDMDELRPKAGHEPLARHHRLGWRVSVRVREAGCHLFVLSRPWLYARHAEDGRRIGVQ